MNIMSGSPRVIVPYIGMERIVETLRTAYNKKVKDIELSELAALLGCSVSNINNVTPTLSLLGLAIIKKRKLSLTNDGLDFIKYYNSHEMERSKEIIKKGIEKSESLKFVKSLLDTRVQLTGEDIGRAISDRYNKKWENIVTYRTFGNSCASILNFAGLGYYYNGVLSLKPPTSIFETEIYAPEVGFKPILRILNALNPYERAKISEVSQKLQAKENRIASELAVCIILGLVERETTGSYKNTEMGRKLIDPRSQIELKSQIIKEALLSSPYFKIIENLSASRTELTYEKIGDSLAYDLRRDWAPLTKKLYGKKFITWLDAAGLVDKIGPNSFKIKTVEKKQIKTIEKQEQKVGTEKLYEIAMSLGALELVTPSSENRESFEDKIAILKISLNGYPDLNLLLDSLKENFDLSIESKNSNIYKKNYNFVANKIREKLKV